MDGDMEDMPIARGGIPVGPTAQIAAADWARDRLAEFGIRIPPGNRLQRAKTLLENVNASSAAFTVANDLLDRVTEAQWTIIELYIITRSLGSPTRSLDVRISRKLEEMLSGSDSYVDDRNPLARNTQFELYVAAAFTMGDVPVTLGEPDLLFDYLGTQCGLAAKRVRSIRQAPRRANEAANQLRAAGLRGVVAVNVDVLLKGGESAPDPTMTFPERLEVVQQIEARMSERPEVVATMTFGRDCIWLLGGPRPRSEMSHSIRFTLHPRTNAEEEAGRVFFNRLMARIEERMQTL